MASFAIQGGHPIEGTVNISGNKNASFPLIAASLLTDETVTLENVPQIDDIATMLTILEGLGVYVRQEGSRLTLRADKLHGHAPDARAVRAHPRRAEPDGAGSWPGGAPSRSRAQPAGMISAAAASTPTCWSSSSWAPLSPAPTAAASN